MINTKHFKEISSAKQTSNLLNISAKFKLSAILIMLHKKLYFIL